MKVVKAKHAGACYGVQRALDMANSAAFDGRPVVTLGPLIHNPQVVSELAARGVGVVDDASQVTQGAVIVRSHGVAPEVKEGIEARGLELIDATCPHVARAQKAAAQLAAEGRCVVVVGEAGHPEVEGLTAYARRAGAQVRVVACAAELPQSVGDPVGVVVQTTQMRERLDEVVGELTRRGMDPKVRDTICFATLQRQEAAAELASQVDAIVVIGGRNSSNTTRLADICRASCERTYHVEGAGELDPTWFQGCDAVGVTAGASTPESQIDDVMAFLEGLA